MKELDLLNPKISRIINDIKRDKAEFSSHDFIKKFAQQFQEKYIDMLYEYKETGHAFQSLHAQIAKHLSENMLLFEIQKSEKKGSEDIFGDIVEIQWWKKL